MRTSRMISQMASILTLLLILPINASHSAVKAGATCKKPGLIKQARDTTFVCAKVGKGSKWIQAGNTSTKSQSPKPQTSGSTSAPTCTTGIGMRLNPTLVKSPEGLALLQIQNPTDCTISYNITGQITCRHYKSARTILPASGTGTLRAKQTVTLYPGQAFTIANQSCQELQRQSGAGPEYGAGILDFTNYSTFSSFTYSASIIGISN